MKILKKSVHYIKITLLSAVMAAMACVGLIQPQAVKAEPTWSTIDELGEYNEDSSLSYDRSLGDNGSIVFITDDARRTSSIYYHTVGFKFYRCLPGTQTRDENTFIVIMLPDPTHEYLYETEGKIRIRAIWHFDFETQILNAISQVSEQWYQEVVTQEQETWLCADGIMQVCFDDNRDGRADRYSGIIKQGYFFEDEMDYGSCRDIGLSSNGTIYAYGDVYETALALRNAQPWGSGTSGIESHFNKFLPLVPAERVPRPEDGTDITDIMGDHRPEFITWNRSTTGEYDLSESIPSTEGITNYVKADAYLFWYTTMERTVTKRYRIQYNVVVKYTAEGIRAGSTYFYQDELYANKFYDIDRKAVFHHIVDANIYDWVDATVYNDTFPGGQAYYQSNWTPSFTLIVNGEDCSTSNYWVNANGIDYDVLDANHIEFPDSPGVQNITLDYTLGAKGRTYTMNEIRAMLDAMDFQSQAQNAVGEVKAHNDTLIVDGVTYLDGEEYRGNATVTCPDGVVKPADFKEEFVGSTIGYSGTPFSKEMTIPGDTPNGEYPTCITVNYQRLAPLNGNTNPGLTYTLTSELSDPEHVVDEGTPEQATQEPVVVHTPVIAPVHVTDDGREDIQLIHPNLDVAYQFILDGTYTFKFDPAMHNDIQGYGWSGDPSKYNEYVRSKEVCFPFEVRIGSDWYEPNEWILVGDETTFYIPPWAIEGVYDIMYRVTAINEHGTGGTEDSANLNPDNYVATYHLSCQVSGQIYDFQVTGLNDKDLFGGFEDTYAAPQEWSFSLNNEAKRVGANNRLGESYVRLADGTVVSSWSTSNILPFSSGSSNTITQMGTLRSGTTFCFTIKTIANLWGENDSIYITPSYRYIDENGNEIEDVSIYYYDAQSGRQFVEVGGPIDATLIHEGTYIDDPRFDGAYRDSDLQFTVSRMIQESMQDPLYKYIYRTVDMFNQSMIQIPSEMRMFIGCEEELAVNLHKNRNEIGTLVIPDGKEEIFGMSMQQWFGTFMIPTDFYVCDSDIDPNEYAYSEEGLSESSSIWYKHGYVILNFDIISLKDGQEHLSYINLDNNVGYGHCNMWRKEGGATTAILEGPKIQQSFTIDVEDGDVAAIYVDRHIYDKYVPSYLFSD